MLLQHFRKNLKYRLIAIFLAIGIWFFVFEDQNPAQESVVNVPLEVRNLEQGFVISDKPNSVNVRFEGRKAVVNGINTSEIKAYIKMTTAEVGKNSLPVYADLPQGLKMIGVEPAYVDVEVDTITSVQLPLEVKVAGTPAKNYEIGNPHISPDHVVVLGPRKALESIGKVFVDVRLLGDEIENYQATLPIKIQDKEGNTIFDEWVKPRIDSAEVYIPIYGEGFSRNIPLTYKLVGKVAQGYEVKHVDIYPKVIDIFSKSSQLLNSTNYLPLEIPLENNKKSFEFEIDLPLPEGVESINSDKAKIFVEIGPKG